MTIVMYTCMFNRLFLSDNIREIIREKALRSASVLCFDTFDDLKSLLAVTLDKELAKRKRNAIFYFENERSFLPKDSHIRCPIASPKWRS